MRTSEDRQAFVARRSAEMQANPTPEEALLWERLRPLGFVSQFPVLDFERKYRPRDSIVDFFHPVSKLVVEADGRHHGRFKGPDERRTRMLQREGLGPVLRFSNTRIRKDIEGVMREIEEAMRRL